MSTRFTLSDLPPHYAEQAQAQMKPKAQLPVSSPTPAGKTPPRATAPARRGIPKLDESRIQQAVVAWWRDNCYEWQLEEELLMAFPLQGKRTARNGSRMKAEGMRRGTPDMLLAVPRGDCCGLWLELKTETGRLSEHQKVMLKRLTNAGYGTIVSHSVEETTYAIRTYLNLPTTKKP